MLTALTLLACKPDVPEIEPPPLGPPIQAAPGEWTWVDVEGTTCDDGSQTGLAVNPGSDEILVFFMGGGACWDYVTCFVANTSEHGPFDADDWRDPNWGPFARNDPDNLFADWTYVFVPYCTGDLHGGEQVITYESGGDVGTMHHTGHTNVMEDLKRLGATWPAPSRVVVWGSSAGAGGAMMNYPDFRWYWPDADMLLINDSLPMLEGDAVQTWLRETWIANWNLQPRMDAFGCDRCPYDFSQVHVKLAERWPDDRMALLTSLQDATIATYLLMSGENFEEEVWRLDTDVLGPTRWERFFVAGDSHTMMGQPGNYETEDGTELWDWLAAMLTDDPSWASVGP